MVVCVLRPFGRAKHLLFYDFISHSTRHRQTGAADSGGGGKREGGRERGRERELLAMIKCVCVCVCLVCIEGKHKWFACNCLKEYSAYKFKGTTT